MAAKKNITTTTFLFVLTLFCYCFSYVFGAAVRFLRGAVRL